ncbi:MAG: leucyl/phenylalanyl-tRNA--protein transferase [Saprospiraceae bacterium]|nr:leucyl/phenylalanyl-tRNA--protein transferase [Saprospiraceae bacterium]
MVILNKQEISFPHPNTANAYGAIAIGGDLEIDRLLLAYQYGYFPWFNPDEPIIWWHPDPRFVIFTDEIRITKSMRPYFNQEKFTISFDQCFLEVLDACQKIKRKNQPGTWITEDIKEAYKNLHQMGLAHSVEVWQGDELVGGLYGVSLGKLFFGESMFSKSANASKFALICLASILRKKGFEIIDCQMPNPHLKRMGGRYISRDSFLNCLRTNVFEETFVGNWNEIMNIYPIKDLIK